MVIKEELHFSVFYSYIRRRLIKAVDEQGKTGRSPSSTSLLLWD